MRKPSRQRSVRTLHPVPVDHYENFPVASWLLPAALARADRRDLRASRAAPTISPTRATRQPPSASPRSTAMRAQLDRIAGGERPDAAAVPGAGRRDPRARRCRSTCFATCCRRSARTSSRRATPTSPRSLDYCRALGQPGRPAAAAPVRRRRRGQSLRRSDAICIGAAADQFLAGRRSRLAQGPRLPAAGRNGALRRRASARSPTRICDDRWRALMASRSRARARMLRAGARWRSALPRRARPRAAHDRRRRPAHPATQSTTSAATSFATVRCCARARLVATMFARATLRALR